MEVISHINYLAVIFAAITTFMVGGLWYGPLFGKAWMALTGIDEEKAAQANMPRTFGLGFTAQLLAAFVLSYLLTLFLGDSKNLANGALLGFLMAAGFIATSMLVNDLFEQRPFKLWLINATNNLVGYSLMGAIIGAW